MDWYFAKGEQQFGPVQLEGLVAAAQSGQLRPSDLVWSEGMPSWVPADSVPDLFSTAMPHPLLERITTGPGSSMLVVGKSLLVVSGAVLPLRCVKTNLPVSQSDMVRKEFYWCSPLWILTFFLGGLVFIIIYYFVRKKCVLTYGFSPEVRSKYRFWQTIKIVAALGLFLGLLFSTVSHSGPLIATVFVMFIVSIIALLVGNSPVSVQKFEDGQFWIKGCSPEFLASIGT